MTEINLQTIWIISGIVFIIGEMVTSGFFLMFISLGCFAAALVASVGGIWAYQGIACAVVSVLGVLVLRKPIQMRMLKTMQISADIGKEIVLDQPMQPHKQSRISYQGTSWLATNLDREELKQGDRIVIVGIDGNELLIRKVH
jgi:membrane protein implicated in regulation of membrane protease activity